MPASWPGQRVPEALDVAARQDHGGVEADDREAARHLEDLADDGLAHLGLEIVELGRVVPGEARAVVAVVDVARLAAGPVDALEDDRGVGRIPVVVFDLDDDAIVGGEVLAREGVGLEGRMRRRDEALRVLDDPARIDAHVVGHHVGCQADAARGRAVAQVAPGGVATQLVGDAVVGDRVRRGHGLGVAAHLLDASGGLAALPEPMSQRPVKPRARSSSSSSSGTWSRR